MCIAKGSDVCPGVPRVPPLCVAGMGQGPLLFRGRRGLMSSTKGLTYGLASLGIRIFCVTSVG